MKVILSRKGFDATSGGGPSPILPDGTLLSIPIPEDPRRSSAATNYGTLYAPQYRLADVMRSLNIAEPKSGAHLDPDIGLYRPSNPRSSAGVFGQSGAAAAHLANQDVGPGDIFLFFGLFAPTQLTANGLEWIRPVRPVHILFGYLQVGTVARLVSQSDADAYAHVGNHPHVRDWSRTNNTLFLASKHLSLDPALPGFGRFRWNPALQLTQREASPSNWLLPTAFSEGALSYHGDSSRWLPHDDGHVGLRAVARGQEFVAKVNPGILEWMQGLLAHTDRAAPEATLD